MASVLHGRGQLLRHRIFLTLVTCFSHATNSSQSPKTSQNINVRDRDWFIMSRKCVSFWWKYSSSSSKLFDLLHNPPANFFPLFPIVKLSDFVLLSQCVFAVFASFYRTAFKKHSWISLSSGNVSTQLKEKRHLFSFMHILFSFDRSFPVRLCLRFPPSDHAFNERMFFYITLRSNKI